MIKKTYQELQELDNVIGVLYRKDERLKGTKFGYAYKRLFDKNILPLFKEFQRVIADIRVDNALEDEKTKEILIDKENYRGFKYSKEGLKKAIAEENKAIEEFDQKIIDVEPYISPYIPEGLTEEEVELLGGILIDKNSISDSSVNLTSNPGGAGVTPNHKKK